MPKAVYQDIYQDLKERIETNEFAFQELLPSEHVLIQQYNCSRNTVRRAISMLVTDGYLQTMQGKGVRNIYQPLTRATFRVSKIETFRESAARNHLSSRSEVISFEERIVSKEFASESGFQPGDVIYAIKRIHVIDEQPLIFNYNYFLKSAVPNLSIEIATTSIYAYIENVLKMTIVNSKRVITIEKALKEEKAYIDLKGYNCFAVVTSQTFNSDGVMFEYTVSKHHPDYFSFTENAVR